MSERGAGIEPSAQEIAGHTQGPGFYPSIEEKEKEKKKEKYLNMSKDTKMVKVLAMVT